MGTVSMAQLHMADLDYRAIDFSGTRSRSSLAMRHTASMRSSAHLSHKLVSIPTSGGAESLNVAMAATILSL